jgi:hypothetical protein
LSNNTPRHRRPDRERTNPQSEYYIPNDPANRAAQPVNGHRPANIPRRTLLEASADLGGTVEEAKLKKRLQQAQDENGGHSEPTTCPLCGLTEIQALATKQPPAMIVGPGTVLCSCRGEPFHVGTELAKLRGERDKARAEILECYFEDVHRAHEPGSTSKGRTRTPAPKADVRLEQEWHGFAADEEEEVERLEKLTFVVKAKVPRALRQRLRDASRDAHTTDSALLRWLLTRHLVAVEVAREVEIAPTNQWLEVKLTKQQFTLFDAKAKALGCSRADLIMTIMLEEWA